MLSRIIKKQEGFTLLELLIVIVIIGILAVLIIPNLATGPKRARDAQRKSDLRNVKTALETYKTDNSSYPTAASWSALKTVLEPNYFPTAKTPNDPTGGAVTYVYTKDTPASGYTLTAGLEAPGATATFGNGTSCTGAIAAGTICYEVTNAQ